jgi:hypothetical protein
MYEEFCAEAGIDEVPDLNSEPGRSCRNCLTFSLMQEMKGFVGATGHSTWRPFGPERLDMSLSASSSRPRGSSTCLKAEGLSTGLPASPPQRRRIKSKAGLPVGLHRRYR